VLVDEVVARHWKAVELAIDFARGELPEKVAVVLAVDLAAQAGKHQLHAALRPARQVRQRFVEQLRVLGSKVENQRVELVAPRVRKWLARIGELRDEANPVLGGAAIRFDEPPDVGVVGGEQPTPKHLPDDSTVLAPLDLGALQSVAHAVRVLLLEQLGGELLQLLFRHHGGAALVGGDRFLAILRPGDALSDSDVSLEGLFGFRRAVGMELAREPVSNARPRERHVLVAEDGTPRCVGHLGFEGAVLVVRFLDPAAVFPIDPLELLVAVGMAPQVDDALVGAFLTFASVGNEANHRRGVSIGPEPPPRAVANSVLVGSLGLDRPIGAEPLLGSVPFAV